MSIHLVGGGWSDPAAAEVFGGFLEESRERCDGERPRIGLVLMGTDEEALEYHQRYVRALGLAGATHELVITRVVAGDPCPQDAVEGIHGLFVGGGPTPEYHASISPLFGVIADLVAGGLPYLGFSAGAAIAPRRGLIGGWRIDRTVVTPEDNSEGLDDVTVVDGIGLVDFTVEVHAAQWGTLGRLVGAVETGLVDQGVAIDESTVLVVDGEVWSVRGEGRVRHVVRRDDGVLVSLV